MEYFIALPIQCPLVYTPRPVQPSVKTSDGGARHRSDFVVIEQDRKAVIVQLIVCISHSSFATIPPTRMTDAHVQT